MDFRDFLIESQTEDIRKTLAKLPKSHQKLVKPFKFVFQDGNTLKGDKGHVGCIDEKKMTITVAAPWFHAREFTFLHEIAHLIWQYILNEKQKKAWNKMAAKYTKKLKDSEEEIFCMIYGTIYTNNAEKKYEIPELKTFVSAIK